MPYMQGSQNDAASEKMHGLGKLHTRIFLRNLHRTSFFQSQMQLLLGITTVSFRTKSLHGLIIAQKCVCAWWFWFFLFDVEMTKT